MILPLLTITLSYPNGHVPPGKGPIRLAPGLADLMPVCGSCSLAGAFGSVLPGSRGPNIPESPFLYAEGSTKTIQTSHRAMINNKMGCVMGGNTSASTLSMRMKKPSPAISHPFTPVLACGPCPSGLFHSLFAALFNCPPTSRLASRREPPSISIHLDELATGILGASGRLGRLKPVDLLLGTLPPPVAISGFSAFWFLVKVSFGR